MSELTANWQGPLDAPTHYRAKAAFQGLTLAARPSTDAKGVGRPGLRNASLVVDANDSGGTARLGLDAGALEFPGVFAEPVVDFDTLRAQLQWKIEPAKAAGALPKVALQVKDVAFANADAQGEIDASWSTGAGQGLARGGRWPGQLELTGRITRGAADKVARYLPLGIPEGPRHYVERAVRGGTVSAATFRIKGDLWDFPFFHAKTTREGEFLVTGKIDDVDFAYVPDEPGPDGQPAWVSPWPTFSRVGGELVIDRASLELRDMRAQWGGVTLSGVHGGIGNLADHATLTIDGVARGPLGELLRFVNASPVAQWTRQALARASSSGNAELRLGMSVPLRNVAATTVKGSVALAGNDLRIAPDTPLLGNARGRVDFTQKGFTVVGATARVLGGDASFDGGMQPDGTMRFNGQGIATAEGLRRATELGPAARAAGVDDRAGELPSRPRLRAGPRRGRREQQPGRAGARSASSAAQGRRCAARVALPDPGRAGIAAGGAGGPRHAALRTRQHRAGGLHA